MGIRIALAGNPNCGKTTLFNALTGSNQFVGNWPGVTVEKKEGKLKADKEITITDLPGIYSLSPYTLEEVVARNYLIDEKPDAILNIIDGTNLERNLYLTTQLVEIGIPVVVAINMMDIVKKSGDKIDTEKLAGKLGVEVVEISALKGTGVAKAAEKAVAIAKAKQTIMPKHQFTGSVEHALAHIEELVLHNKEESIQRWFAIKLFERDEKIIEKLHVSPENVAHINKDIKACEKELGDDAESIITGERYNYIGSMIHDCIKKSHREKVTVSDRIDRVVTNRILALPIFAIVMVLVYYISVTTVGTWATDWANDGVFGDGWHLFAIGSNEYNEAVEVYGEKVNPADYGIWIPGVPVVVEEGLNAIHCADWLQHLILDGIVAGVGAVLGFLPQMMVLFIFLAFLEACGYMARVAFIMDRIFRKFGLSGKSFIPMLIGTGCGVPGIMASRTIENDRDRKMTIMTTTFIPCGAKLPFIGMIAGAIFGGSPWIAPGAYFLGVAAVICSGIMLKKTKLFSGDPAPFVMELPAYHWPTVGNVLRSMWERAWSFIKKAGTIILLATILVWFTTYFGMVDGQFRMLEDTEISHSILASLGNLVAWIFIPLGWGNWQAVVASITGLIAKENIVATMGILYGAQEGVYTGIAAAFTTVSGYSFLAFNLLCAPCFAAIGAIKREMNNRKWTWFAIGYQCGFAYVVALLVNQLGNVFATGNFGIGGFFAIVLLAGMIYMLLRRDNYKTSGIHVK